MVRLIHDGGHGGFRPLGVLRDDEREGRRTAARRKAERRKARRKAARKRARRQGG